jgi:alpha-galactosidase
MTLCADSHGVLRQIGLGAEGATVPLAFDAALYPEYFPTWGGGDGLRDAPLRVTHHDGTLSTQLRATTMRSEPREDGHRGNHIRVHCIDPLYRLDVTLHFRTHPDTAMVETWTEIIHHEPGPITLDRYDSFSPLLICAPSATLTHFGGGGWATEWAWTTETITTGSKTLASFGGIQPHLQRNPAVLLAPNGPASENEGVVIGAALCWGGNTHFTVDSRFAPGQRPSLETRVSAGANFHGAPYLLDPATPFVTPAVAWTYSTAGRSGVANAFQQWTRATILRDPQRRRAIVSNNWEATFFDFDEKRILGLIETSATLGAELFLLDDGWFGTRFPRNDDTQGLGDWSVNTAKLPGGLETLAQAAETAGIRFGIWLEPEMVNPSSECYLEHPDWVVGDGRPAREHRNQLFLDPLNPEVQAFEFETIAATLRAAPSTSYIKWDANRAISNPGSAMLGSDRQANLWFDQPVATWQLMERVAAEFPAVEMMLCASGGGRCDHGTLRYFHEFWTSDNTDPVERVRMQWACSHFFPSNTIAAHVTRWGGRPLEFAAAVALSARFGLDLDIAALSPKEREVCRRAIAFARRTQEIVQFGQQHWLVSPVEPVDSSRAALAFHDPGTDRSVLFFYQLEPGSGPTDESVDSPDGISTVTASWLRPESHYRVTITDLSAADRSSIASGAVLRDLGFDWPLTAPTTAQIALIEPTNEPVDAPVNTPFRVPS